MLDEAHVRREKLRALRDQGMTPYPARVTRSEKIGDLLACFDERVAQGKSTTVMGRVMTTRVHGGLLFADLKDESGKIQTLCKRDDIGESLFTQFHDFVDPADFIEVTGTPLITKRGEKTLHVTTWRFLAKSLLPLPEKWHGLTDIEARFRKRYLDLVMNDEVKTRMIMRSRIISSIRSLLDSRGFIEVETPTLQPVYGGGFARPFVTHHNALDTDFYLRISDEMYLKRLLVGGIEKVYEITKVFRNEGIDRDHNPEFTMFEAQIAYEDYRYGMDIFEEIFEHAAVQVLGTTKIQHGDVTIDVQRPWRRFRLVEAVEDIGKLRVSRWKDVEQAKAELRSRLDTRKQGGLEHMRTLGELIAFAFEELVEEQLLQPTIIYDYPVEVSPLAKKTDDPRFVERFEAFALGSEIGNNYSELNDPIDLEQRFIEEKKKEAAGFDEAHQTDYDYLEAIQHGMPPACGLGIGVDRMTMLLTGASNIKEVILFPTLRPEDEVPTTSAKQSTQVAHAVLLSASDIPLWSRLNTISHLAASFAAREGKKLIGIETTLTKDGERIPMDIQHAIMVKKAENSVQLLMLKRAAEAAGLQIACVTQDMQNSTDNKKVQIWHGEKVAGDLRFLGVLVFGSKKAVEEITKDFSLLDS